MTDFTLHDTASAPDASKSLLESSEQAFGMIPNLHAVMAEAPTLLKGYQQLHELAQETSFNADELTVVWQTINVEHGCHYCVPAHTAIAKNMDVDDALIDALRNDETLADEKLNALKNTTLALVRNRGHLNDAEKDTFFSAGFDKQNLLEIVLIVAQKVMSNYVNHFAETPVDEPFKKFSWSK